MSRSISRAIENYGQPQDPNSTQQAHSTEGGYTHPYENTANPYEDNSALWTGGASYYPDMPTDGKCAVCYFRLLLQTACQSATSDSG